MHAAFATVEEVGTSAKSLVIFGRAIPFELKSLDIYSVDYYYENPRVNYVISKLSSGAVTSSHIESALLDMDSTKDLIHDIEENGGLLEPIIVYSDRVIEGNTRLCAYRRLHAKTKDDRWRYIRAQVINDYISPKEIFVILSNYHIKGKKEWDTYEKAACIRKMLDQGQTIDEVAKLVGSNKPKVENMLKAYEAMRTKFLPKLAAAAETVLDDGQALRKFSYFEAMFINKDLSKRADDTPAFVDEFAGWVQEGRIPKAQDVRQLHEILGNKKARKEFESEEPGVAYEAAQDILRSVRPDKVAGFYRQVSLFTDMIKKANVEKTREEIECNPNKKNVLKQCLHEFEKYCKEVGLASKNMK